MGKKRNVIYVVLSFYFIITIAAVCYFAAQKSGTSSNDVVTELNVPQPPLTEDTGLLPEEAEEESITEEKTPPETVPEQKTAEEEKPPVYEEKTEPQEEKELSAPEKVELLFTSTVSKNLNIRETPEADGKIIGKIKKKTSGTVLEEDQNGWTKISYDGIVGYCSSQYIKVEEVVH